MRINEQKEGWIEKQRARSGRGGTWSKETLMDKTKRQSEPTNEKRLNMKGSKGAEKKQSEGREGEKEKR